MKRPGEQVGGAPHLRRHQVLGVVVLRHDGLHHSHQTPECVLFTLEDEESDGRQPERKAGRHMTPQYSYILQLENRKQV